jgi:hypothetical protein
VIHQSVNVSNGIKITVPSAASNQPYGKLRTKRHRHALNMGFRWPHWANVHRYLGFCEHRGSIGGYKNARAYSLCCAESSCFAFTWIPLAGTNGTCKEQRPFTTLLRYVAIKSSAVGRHRYVAIKSLQSKQKKSKCTTENPTRDRAAPFESNFKCRRTPISTVCGGHPPRGTLNKASLQCKSKVQCLWIMVASDVVGFNLSSDFPVREI